MGIVRGTHGRALMMFLALLTWGDVLRGDDSLSTEQTAFVRAFHFDGNKTISSAELAAALKQWTGKSLTSEQLEEARRAVTMVYVNKGYINSGAELPDQKVINGVVTFRITEGRLSRINISGLKWLGAYYIRSRIEWGAGPPLNIVRLKNQLEILREDPNIATINAELKPGSKPGLGDLDVTVRESPLFHFGIEFDNKHPPDYGAEEFEAIGSVQDLTGNGDALNLKWGITQGGFQDMSFGDLNNLYVDYALPLSPTGTALELNYDRSHDLVIEQPFVPLGIQNQTEEYNITLHQPVYHTRETELSFFLTGSVEDNTTLLDGMPFSFSPGQVNGYSRVSALRLGLDLTHSDQTQAISLRSMFSVGLHVLDSTIATQPGVPDSRFFDWLEQFQYIRRLGTTDNQLIFRTSAQISDDPLLPQEQFAEGGFDSVRGYRESQVVRDEGVLGSLELHVPLLYRHGVSILELAPFSDLGYAWDYEHPQQCQFLSSVGVGLLFHYAPHFDARIYYGYPFEHFQQSSYNLQDNGIHFDIVVWAF